MYGLTVAESRGHPDKRPFLDLIAEHGAEALTNPADHPTWLDILISPWLESYIEQLITRDATELEPGRDPDRLRRYFEAIALNTAGFVDQVTLAGAAGVDKRTATAYEQLLRNLLVVDALPAWTTNRLKRLVRGPNVTSPTWRCSRARHGSILAQYSPMASCWARCWKPSCCHNCAPSYRCVGLAHACTIFGRNRDAGRSTSWLNWGPNASLGLRSRPAPQHRPMVGTSPGFATSTVTVSSPESSCIPGRSPTNWPTASQPRRLPPYGAPTTRVDQCLPKNPDQGKPLIKLQRS